MSDDITQADIDNLTDIIWWIKGFLDGCDRDGNSCPFSNGHIESLRKARLKLNTWTKI
jgi:hypothetical protein